MPIIRRFTTCVVRINPFDHNPPHFHVTMKDGRQAWVDIRTLEIVGRVDRREIDEALEWAARNQESLLKSFEEYRS
jgi:hypothetical protein